MMQLLIEANHKFSSTIINRQCSNFTQLTTTATAPQATKADTTGSCRHGYHPRTYCMFAMEYAPFGDLTSMVGEPASGIICGSEYNK